MITIKTLEWFDRINGNTYFSAEVYLGMDKILSIPFQYGYNGAIQEVETKLCKHFNIPDAKYGPDRWAVREMLKKNGVLISESKSDSLKKYLNKESFEDFSAFTKSENLFMYAAFRLHKQIPFIEGKTARFLNQSYVLFNDGSDILLSGVNWF